MELSTIIRPAAVKVLANVSSKKRLFQDLGDIVAKWRAFGWSVLRVDGHDVDALDEAVSRSKKEKGKPRMIVADTIKGKGAFFVEGRPDSHKVDFDIMAAQKAILRLG